MNLSPIRFGSATPTPLTTTPVVRFGFEEDDFIVVEPGKKLTLYAGPVPHKKFNPPLVVDAGTSFTVEGPVGNFVQIVRTPSGTTERFYASEKDLNENTKLEPPALSS